MYLNLYNPTDVSLIEALILSYLLGIVHGITPDEHTWPITFSYSVGSYSTKGGAKAGLLFSLGFTAQRSILSEVAYVGLAGVFITAAAFGITYIAVGVAMAAAGFYVVRFKKYPHWHYMERKLGLFLKLHKSEKEQSPELQHKRDPSSQRRDEVAGTKPVPLKLALLHGFVAGFGFGAFALLIYFVLAPAMPSALYGWVPGMLFGLGTMTMQILFGAVFGRYMRHAKRLTENGIKFVARTISGFVLRYGGIAFIVGGILILAFPQLLSYGINTGIKVHNLDNLGIGFFLVIISVVIIGIIGYFSAMSKARKLGYVSA